MPFKDPAARAAYRKRWDAAHPGIQIAYRKAQDPEGLRQAAYGKRWYTKNRDLTIERAKAWNAAHPDRLRLMNEAGRKVQAALRGGVLVRPDTCEACGVQARIEAAHHDYAKPLEVRWLCRSCHIKSDRAQPKSI